MTHLSGYGETSFVIDTGDGIQGRVDNSGMLTHEWDHISILDGIVDAGQKWQAIHKHNIHV
jgi:hypothetical protein